MLSQTAKRAIQAETAAFTDLYHAGEARWQTAVDSIDGISIAWSPQDQDAAFSPILNLSDTQHKEHILQQFEARGRQRSMPHIGINGNPEIDRWAESTTHFDFHAEDQEHFWSRPISPDEPEPPLPDGLTIQPATPEHHPIYSQILNTGFQLPPEHVRGNIFASAIQRPNWLHYLVHVDGQPAAASALYIAGDVAQLFISATLPQFRRRGCQTYLIQRRLYDAAQLGCTLATTQSVTDNASPRNVQRHNFTLLYTRTIYVKPLPSS